MASTPEELAKVQVYLAQAAAFLNEAIHVEGVPELMARLRVLEQDVADTRALTTGGRR